MQQLADAGVKQREDNDDARNTDSTDLFCQDLPAVRPHGAGWILQGADFNHARDLVARVQDDVQRAAEFTRANEKERVRYENVQHHLSEFDRELRRDHFDKDKLDDAIDNLKDVVKNNTLESHDRDALASDLSDLRTLRDIR